MPNLSKDPLERAGEWLLHSGIQDAERGVARYYRTDEARNQPVSTEITGYLASALVYLYAATGREEYLARAVETARFLTRRAWDAERRLFPFECSVSSPAYFFDSGIILRGLLSVWRVTRDPEFLEAAVVCGDGMLEAFDSGFDYHPVLDLPGKTPAVRDARWSRSSGCYQLKVGLSWHELARESGGVRFEDAYRHMVQDAVREHAAFLPGHTEGAKVMDRLHAYCYFLEALLSAEHEPALAEGIQRVAYFLHTLAPTVVRSDVYAQLLRVRLYADRMGVLPLDRGTAVVEAATLAKFQGHSADPRINGGFWFGARDGKMLPHVNPVSTVFGMQALRMWRGYENAAGLPYLHLLI